jgi:hypothetical protein
VYGPGWPAHPTRVRGLKQDASFEEGAENGEDYLDDMSDAEKQELKRIIGDYLQARHPPKFYQVENSVKKTMTRAEFEKEHGPF